jgi:hypothetical protein
VAEEQVSRTFTAGGGTLDLGAGVLSLDSSYFYIAIATAG